MIERVGEILRRDSVETRNAEGVDPPDQSLHGHREWMTGTDLLNRVGVPAPGHFRPDGIAGLFVAFDLFRILADIEAHFLAGVIFHDIDVPVYLRESVGYSLRV